MGIPTTGEDLYEARALLHKSARHEALATEGGGLFLVEAVHLLDVLRLGVDAHHFGHFHLHPVGEFVALHAGGEIAMLGVAGGMLVVEEAELVDELALVLAVFEGL